MAYDPRPPIVGSRIHLDLGAFRANVTAFRDLLGTGVAVGGVVKGNAYGHGLDAILPAAHATCDVLHVVTAGEALHVRAVERARDLTRRRVLVIGPVRGPELVDLAAAGVEVVVGDAGTLADVVAAAPTLGAPLAVHVHVDSGLSREGFAPAHLADALAPLATVGDRVRVVGLLTHFADVEDVTEQRQALRQLEAFAEGERVAKQLLADLGRPTELERHTAASAAALVLPPSRYDAVRVGIAAYGLWPSRETRIGVRAVLGREIDLRPVLSWRCPSQVVKAIEPGAYVGYGCTWRAEESTTVAVFPVGYHDGYPRLLSNQAHVLVRGRRCRVLGRVMMNHLVVDVTRVASPGDDVVATLIGRDDGAWVSADDLAGWAQTISYEIVTRLGAHLPRDVVDDPA